MKTVYIIFLALIINLNANELDWVNQQIEAIKPVRIGLNEADLLSLKDPLVFIKKDKESDKITIKKTAKKTYRRYSKSSKKVKSKADKQIRHNYHVEVIMNKSARINGKWYKLGEKIDRYTLQKIERTFVLLSAKGKYIMLSTSNKNRTIKFKNR